MGRGNQLNSVGVLLPGRVRTVKLLEDGRRLIGAFLWPGDLFGIDDQSVYDFGTEAVTDVTLRRYPRRTVEALAESHTALALRLRALMAADLQHAYPEMMLLVVKRSWRRWHLFCWNWTAARWRLIAGIVDLPMGRADIADYLGMTTETVSRSFARLRRYGALAILPSGFELHDRVGRIRLGSSISGLTQLLGGLLWG